MKNNLEKAFEHIEKHDLNITTVFIPEYCADKVIKDLKNINIENAKKVKK